MSYMRRGSLRRFAWIASCPALLLLLGCLGVTPRRSTAQGTVADAAGESEAFSAVVNCPKLRLTPELFYALDRLVPLGMKFFDVPGSAIALIQDGKVVYAKGFGVRNIESGEPFALDTVYRIGSTTKAMTAMLAAIEVDDGLVAWDTPVHSLRSDFRLPTEQLTDTIQVQQLMNMGTGIRDAPFLQYCDRDSPEHLWRTVRDLSVAAPPETKFIYNNSIYALGGYVGALAQGVPIPELLDSYTSALKERIFDPIEMPTSAVTDKPETLSHNVATPYGYDLTEDVLPRHPDTYTPVRAVAPAGAVASTMNDMGRYVITQLQRGVAPNGQRVVSTVNLEKTWKGQIPLAAGAGASYALGWIDVDDSGLRLLAHSGSLDGFKTDITMLPEAGIGMIIFTNSTSGSYFATAVRDWILRSVGGKPMADIRDTIKSYAKQKAFIKELRASIVSFKPECSQITDYVGTYEKGWLVKYDNEHRLWLTRSDYYRRPLFTTANGYLVGAGWEDLDMSSLRASFVSDADGSRRMDFFRIDDGSSERNPVDSVKQTAAQPVTCDFVP